MATVSDSNRNRAALWTLSVIAAVAAGVAFFVPNAKRDHVELAWTATPDANANKCWRGTVRATEPGVLASFGLEEDDGGTGLALASSCFYEPPQCKNLDGSLPDDAGIDLCATEVQILPPGIEWSSDEEIINYKPGDPTFEIWLAESDQAPFRCACGVTTRPARGPCEKLAAPDAWVPATEDDMALQPDQWRGGCRRHPCTTWGESASPTKCCTAKCKPGWECGTDKCGGTCGACGDHKVCVGHQCVRECAAEWQCGPSPWSREVTTCGVCGPKQSPPDDPDAGICWANRGTCDVADDAGILHFCSYERRRCPKPGPDASVSEDAGL